MELGFFKRKNSKIRRFGAIVSKSSEFVAAFDAAIPCASDQAPQKSKQCPCFASKSKAISENVPPLRLKVHAKTKSAHLR